MEHWHDGVHYTGLAGGALAIIALLLGATIYLGFSLRAKRFNDPLRGGIRTVHMCAGASAVVLALTHYVGRRVQAGEYGFEMSPPFYAGALFLLVGLSGVLRYWTPRPLRKRWMTFAYIHRLAVLGALYTAFRHTMHQVDGFRRLGGM